MGETEGQKTEELERCGGRGSHREMKSKKGMSERLDVEKDLTLTIKGGGPGPRAKECGQSLEAEKDTPPHNIHQGNGDLSLIAAWN